MLHEAIPLTGTIVSGTYAGANIKNYTHGMFQSVYDYPYLSSSANHIFDITLGFSATSELSASSPTTTANPQQAKKINIYNEMAQLLVGYDVTGGIRQFDQDGDLTGGAKIKECFFISFARLLNKDEIKKQSFSMTLVTGGYGGAEVVRGGSHTTDAPSGSIVIQDAGALSSYKVNSPAGEYGLLYSGSTSGSPVGLVYYQAGIVVLTASCFGNKGTNPPGATPGGDGIISPAWFGANNGTTVFWTISQALTGSSISGSCSGLRARIANISFNNTTELNSSIYFCRANNNEFNYSSNPTYLNASKLRIKNKADDTPVSYITTVGLYSGDNELLAVAKLSEPLKKTPDDEFTLRVRLDY
jgi:hypothetical protein